MPDHSLVGLEPRREEFKVHYYFARALHGQIPMVVLAWDRERHQLCHHCIYYFCTKNSAASPTHLLSHCQLVQYKS